MAIRLPCLLLLPLLAASGATAQESDITIYRCTDAAGHLTVQDSPCATDQLQQVRRMIQPTDPPPRAEPVEPAALQPAPDPRPQPVVVLHAPRPMYECIRDDGSRYTSDDDDGNPRWVSTGWSYYRGPSRRRGSGITYSRGQATPTATTASPRGGTSSSGNGPPTLRFRSVDPTPPPPQRPPPGHGHGGHHGPGYGYGGGGYWVHDECHPLPQREVCARLRDRREQIRQRAFNAQANERATLNVEERGINVRLSEDCGGA